MKKIKYKFVYGLLVLSLALSACEKYLDAKPSASYAVPNTLADFQALLDNYERVNYRGISSGLISSDDYFITDNDYNAIAENFKRLYTWQGENLFPNADNDWSFSYNKVYTANVVLDEIEKIDRNAINSSEYDNVKGQALFTRAYAFFNLAVTFSLSYDRGTAATILGIPLRLTSDINEKITRPSLQATFEKILDDTKLAADLLSPRSIHILRPSKPAAYALLSRIYLYMKDYDNCYKYADLCLQEKDTLISYNAPDIPNIAARFPFSAPDLMYKNPEIIYGSRIDPAFAAILIRAKVDTNLLKLYDENDNRSKVYFDKGIGINNNYIIFKGSYEGNSSLFNGFATDEMYITRSEAAARLNRLPNALSDLNRLLSKRWDSNAIYVPVDVSNAEQALEIILRERRKTLVFRGIRWMDLKRLGASGTGTVLTRTINGNLYTLQPNDLRYAISIPESIIMASGIPQNPR